MSVLFIGKLFNTILAIFNLKTNKFAKNNIEAIVEQRLEKAKSGRKQIIEALSVTGGQLSKSERIMNAAKDKFDEWQTAFEGARRKQNEALGRQLYPKLQAAKQTFEDAQADYNRDAQSLKALQQQRDKYEETIRQLERQAKQLVAQDKSAKAREKVAEVMSGFDDNMPSFDDLLTSADERSARADAMMATLEDPDEDLLKQGLAAADGGFDEAFGLPSGEQSVFAALPSASTLEVSVETQASQLEAEQIKQTIDVSAFDNF